MTNNFYKQTLLPRLCNIPYFLVWFILRFFSVVYWLNGSRRSCEAEPHLCIEAGPGGWESIEFKELYQSACEYIPHKNVHRLIVQPDQCYLKQIANLIKSAPITHYLYDPRTDNSEILLWSALLQSFRVAMLLNRHGIVPIVLLTDLSVRVWRSQAAVVSARKGLVVCFMSPRLVAPIFPHHRLLGPSLMPFSMQTLKMLNGLIEQRRKNKIPTAVFTGSLYEPRATKLEQIRSGLAFRGLVFDVKGRPMGSARLSDIKYWSILSNADIVVTTADQAIQEVTDWTHIPHLVYRYLEVLASGSLLVAQDVPSVRRYFTPGIHFVSFDTPENAIDVISYFMGNEAERLLIARQGKARADALISSRSFWTMVDTGLGQDSLF
jgi:hypothetical protein